MPKRIRLGYGKNPFRAKRNPIRKEMNPIRERIRLGVKD